MYRFFQTIALRILNRIRFRTWAKHDYMWLYTSSLCCPDYFDLMNDQNKFLDSQPNEPAPRPITSSEVYSAPSSLQNFVYTFPAAIAAPNGVVSIIFGRITGTCNKSLCIFNIIFD